MGENYLRSLAALGLQAFLILVCVGIYGALIGNIGSAERVKAVAHACARKNIPAEAAVPVSHRAYQERQYDLLAAELRKALDMEALWQIVDGKGGDR